MSTLILDKVLSGYNLAKVNDNFERIEKAFNEALLHRDGSKELTDDLDVNSQKLLNVGGIEIGGVDITESITQLREEWESLFQGIEEYKAAADEILAEAISYGAVDQKNIGNAQRVFTTSSNYATNSNLILPLPYIVGKNTLKLNLGHYYDMFNGVDYEEVGTVGSTSTTIKLLRPISSGAEIEEFVDGSSDLYSIYSTAEALQTLLTTSYSPDSIEEFVNSVSDIQELGLEDKIAQLNSLYDSLVSLQTSLQTTVADINTKYSTITDMYEDMGTKYSLLEALYPQLLALLSDTNFDLDDLNTAVGDINDAIDDLEDLVPTIEGYKDDAETAATSAESSASSASTSATAAAGSASSAAGALTNAQIWAEGSDEQVASINGEHSSKEWSNIAKGYSESVQNSLEVISNNLSSLVDSAITSVDIPGQIANAIIAENLPGLVENEVTEELTEQLRETIEEVVGEVLEDDLVEVLGYTPANDSQVIKHSSQNLSNSQKTQARSNIGAQKALTFDSSPTVNSDNPVTSAGIKTALDTKFDKSGGTLTGSIISNTGNFVFRNVDNAELNLQGGSSITSGRLVLKGKDSSSNPSGFILQARNASTTYTLSGEINGNLTWNGAAAINGNISTKGQLNIGATGSGEGGEIRLNAADNAPTRAGIVLDNQNSNFRIFGTPSSDGTSKTGVGTPFVVDPYAKTVTGGYTFTGNVIGVLTSASYVAVKRSSNTWGTQIAGGTSADDGANLLVYGGASSSNTGEFRLTAKIDNNNQKTLKGTPNGALTWNNKNVLVDGIIASGGTASRNISDRFSDFINVRDFGAKGDGTTDDATAFQSALTYVGNKGGGIVYFDGKHVINSSLTIPQNVTLCGQIKASGAINIRSVVNSTLLLSPSASITLSASSCLCECTVLNKSLSYPFASTEAAASGIQSFSGKAITIGGHDCYVHHVSIAGFEYAIYSNSYGRIKLDTIYIDCTNGIYLNGSKDISRLRDIHAWPFTTSYLNTSSLNIRTGTAYQIIDSDWTKLNDCSCYGYRIGVLIEDGHETMCISVGLECSQEANSIGIKIVDSTATIIGSTIKDTNIGILQECPNHTSYISKISESLIAAAYGVQVSSGTVKVNSCDFETTSQNLLTSGTGKIKLSGEQYETLSTTEVDLTLPASGGTVAAPANGWVQLSKKSGAANEYVRLVTDMADICYSTASGQELIVNVPIRKGQTVRANYTASGTTNYFKFKYDPASAWEAT